MSAARIRKKRRKKALDFMERLSSGNAMRRLGKTEMVTRLWLQAIKRFAENKR